MEPKNSVKLSPSNKKEKPSFEMKTKIPMMKIMAEIPPTNMTACTRRSKYQDTSRRSRRARFFACFEFMFKM